MNGDLDVRARDAADAARSSVARVARGRVSPTPGPRGRRVVVAGAALAAVVAVALLASGDEVTTVSTTPAKQGTLPDPGPPRPPSPDLSPGGPFATPLAEGTASDGRAWALNIGGPSNDLCLSVDLREPYPSASTSTCAGAPFGAPPLDPDRPLVFNDTRLPGFVFGRMPAGVGEVSVVLADATVLGRRPVVAASGGAFYVVELPNREEPVAVVGHRADGSSVRRDL